MNKNLPPKYLLPMAHLAWTAELVIQYFWAWIVGVWIINSSVFGSKVDVVSISTALLPRKSQLDSGTPLIGLGSLVPKASLKETKIPVKELSVSNYVSLILDSNELESWCSSGLFNKRNNNDAIWIFGSQQILFRYIRICRICYLLKGLPVLVKNKNVP